MTRRRYVYDPESGEMVEVSPDYVPEPRAVHRVVGDRHYDGLKTADGADISSRTKHREYMKRTGLATVDDFKETWRNQEKQRMAVRQGVDPTRRQHIIEAIHKLNR